MNRTPFAKSVARRSVLSAAGAGLASLLIRPLQAQEALGPPKRLLIVHRPCGSVLDRFFPPNLGNTRDFVLPEILEPLAALKNDLVILDGVSCPRDRGWAADQHAAGLIAMMSGKKFLHPGSPSGDPNDKAVVAADQSIDQYLLTHASAFKASGPSIQSTAFHPSTSGLPSFKVMSYKGSNQPQFPVDDASALFTSVFGRPWPTAEQLPPAGDAQSVLDCVNADLARLQGLVPASQKYKLEAHLAALMSLQGKLSQGAGTPAAQCNPPPQLALPEPVEGATPDEARHQALAQNQLTLIRTAFQCDVTRVATFSFAHGNSDLRFKNILPNFAAADGHHGLSSTGSADPALARIDRFYCEQLAAFAQQLKGVEEEDGTLLDNTLIVYLSEVAVGLTHSIENMPLLMLGGKNLGLQTGQYLNFNGRFMNDVWAALCGALGLEPQFGDAAFSQGPVSGLFA